MTLEVTISTPEKTYPATQADEIILSTNSGQMGVLTDHAPVITGLDVGVMLMRQQREWKSFALNTGYALIKENRVLVQVTDAEAASEINATEAEQAYEKALRDNENASDTKQKLEAKIVLKRAKARFQAVQAVA